MPDMPITTDGSGAPSLIMHQLPAFVRRSASCEVGSLSPPQHARYG